MHLHHKRFLLPLLLHLIVSFTFNLFSHISVASRLSLAVLTFFLFHHNNPPTHSLTQTHTHTIKATVQSQCRPLWPGGVRIKRPWEPCTSDQPWRVSDCLLNLLWQMDRCTTAAVWVWNRPLKEYEERSDPWGELKWTSTHVPQRYVWCGRQTCRKLQSALIVRGAFGFEATVQARKQPLKWN